MMALMRARVAVAAVVLTGAMAGCRSTVPAGPSSTVSAPGGPSPSPVPATSVPEDPGPSAGPRFRSSISPIDDALAERMSDSWRPGCPVPLADLRYVTVSHWGYDGAVHQGELVVHRGQAGKVVSAFREVFRARFPIRRMVLVDEYGADDDASMAANNTSAFNCRLAVGGSSWSEHASGLAIDINPVQNPYVKGSTVLPPSGEPYVDRSKQAKGMIHGGDAVVRAFAAIGWEWGGEWTTLKDYQHFSLTGR
jgi:hypothetical protein